MVVVGSTETDLSGWKDTVDSAVGKCLAVYSYSHQHSCLWFYSSICSSLHCAQPLSFYPLFFLPPFLLNELSLGLCNWRSVSAGACFVPGFLKSPWSWSPFSLNPCRGSFSKQKWEGELGGEKIDKISVFLWLVVLLALHAGEDGADERRGSVFNIGNWALTGLFLLSPVRVNMIVKYSLSLHTLLTRLLKALSMAQGFNKPTTF